MKFKTRLYITFLTIVLLPLFLTFLAFVSIWSYMAGRETDFGIEGDYFAASEPLEALGRATEETYQELLAEVIGNTGRIEDTGYLEELNRTITRKASYLLVRKDDEIFIRATRRLPRRFLTGCRPLEPWTHKPKRAFILMTCRNLHGRSILLFLTEAREAFL